MCVPRFVRQNPLIIQRDYHMNTGNRFGGDPAIGSWVTYGLGSENQNLPGYVVLPEVAYPQGDSQLV